MTNSTQNTQNQEVTVNTNETTSNGKFWSVVDFCNNNSIDLKNVGSIVLNGKSLEFSTKFNMETRQNEIIGLQTKW